MAQQERPIRDIRVNPTGVYFDVPGARIQSSIREKINDRLDREVERILEKLVAQIPDDKKKLMALFAAVASMKSTKDLSADAAELVVLCQHLQELTDEVAELQQLGRNLFTDEIYRLGIEEVKRFGL